MVGTSRTVMETLILGFQNFKCFHLLKSGKNLM